MIADELDSFYADQQQSEYYEEEPEDMYTPTSTAPAALYLTDNTIYDLAFAYNKNTGIIYVFGQDLSGNILFQRAYIRTYANSKITNPSEFDTYVIAGTSNAASSYVIYDDIDVHANLCLFYDQKETTAFTYSSNSVCKQATTITPTQTDPNVTGTYSSSNGLSITAGTGAINLANSTAGTYAVKLVSSGTSGCKDSTTYSITIKDVPAVPTISANGPLSFCQGGNVVLSVTPANNTTYLWSDNSTNNSLTASSNGSYTVTATSNGCSSTSASTSVTVNTPPSTPSISASGSTTFCQGGSVVLSVASPVNGLTYTWSNSTTGTTLTATTQGSYSVIASNGGCSSSASNAISTIVNASPVTPVISANGPTSFCQGGNVVLSITPVNGVSYLWSDNSTSNSISASTTGSYSVVATSNGCSTNSAVTAVTVNTPPSTPSITAAGTTTFCQGGSVVLNVNSPVGGLTYTWSNNATGTSITATNQATYSVVASNGGCSSSASNGISTIVNAVPTTPVISANGPTSFCQGGNVVLSITPVNGETYLWSNSSIGSSITATSTGSYSVVASSNGCSTNSSATSVTVNTPPSTPSISASGSTTFCQGGSVVLSVTSPVNGVTYTWSNNAVGNSITATSAANYTVTASLNNCSSTSQATTVTISNGSITTPVISASGSTAICSGTNVVLSVTPANNTTYTWSNNATGSSLTATTAGNYTVTAMSNGCTATSSPVAVTVAPSPTQPVITSFGSTTICQGNSVTLSVSPDANTTYTWSNGGSGNTISVSTSGYYAVTATKGNCSLISSSVTVTVNPIPSAPVINVSGATTLCQGTSSFLSVIPANNTTYVWSNNTTGVSTTVTTSGNYSVVATSNGCSATSAPVTMTFNNCASLDEVSNSNFEIYPNPAEDMLYVKLAANESNTTISLLASDGKLIEKRIVSSLEEQFDVSKLDAGVYFFKIENGNLNTSSKVIIK